MSYQDVPGLKADRAVVVDLTEHMRKAFEDFCKTYHKELPYLDAFMGVHNFHKVIVRDIADRANMPPPARALYYKMAVDTLARAFDTDIEKEIKKG